MTKRIVQYELDDGSTISFETAYPIPPNREIPATNASEKVVEATETFDSALDRITPAMRILRKKLEDLRADEVEVTFGLKVTAGMGMIIASGEIEANYSVTLKWDNSKKDE